MGLLDSIVQQKAGGLITQIAGQFGLDEETAKKAVSALVPALSEGLTKNISSGDGLQSLVSALGRGNHGNYVDNPASLSDPATTVEGNGILGHLLGSKEVSRNVAATASEQTGVKSSTLKQLLPVVATVAMGVLSKQDIAKGGAGSLITGALTSFLKPGNNDSDDDGLLGLAKKLF